MDRLGSETIESVSIYKLKGHDFRGLLPSGANRDISQKTGFTPSYVSRVIKGVSFNEEIMKEIIETYNNVERVQVPKSLIKRVN